MKDVLLIVNPKAGKTQSKTALYDIISPLCSHGIDPVVHITTSSGDATDYITEHGENFDTVICVGGDGTLNETIAGVMSLEKPIPIGYIPAGSTNDLASSLGLPKDIPSAIKAIINGEPKYFDIGRMNGRYFSYIACFGAFTKTSYSTPQNLKNSLGHFAYVLEGIKSLGEIKPYHAKITVDGTEIEGDYLYCAVSNSTSVAGMIKLDKDLVDFTDGIFEIMLVKAPKDILEFNKIITSLTLNKFDTDMVSFFHGKDFAFTVNHKIGWTVDGEYGGSFKTAEIRCLHNTIQIIR